jgi:head-tail adaptor
MSQGYRKLKLLLNTQSPHDSRVIDVESGENIQVSDVQVNVGYDTKFTVEVRLTIPDSGIDIEVISDNDSQREVAETNAASDSPFLSKETSS